MSTTANGSVAGHMSDEIQYKLVLRGALACMDTAVNAFLPWMFRAVYSHLRRQMITVF